MSYHVYVPFPEDKSLVTQAESFIGMLQDKANTKSPGSIVKLVEQEGDAETFSRDKKYLPALKSDDVLYVFGHGKPADERIYGTTTDKVLTPEQLAAQFKGQLKRDHKKIKLWVCYSGYGAKLCRGLAYKFYQAMHLNFQNLEVVGYTFEIGFGGPGGPWPPPKTPQGQAISGPIKLKERDKGGVMREIEIPNGQYYRKAAHDGVYLAGKASQNYRVIISKDGSITGGPISAEDLGIDPLPEFPLAF